MAKTIQIKSNNRISEIERATALQYMQDHLTDDELNKLYQLAQSEKSRIALQNNWEVIQNVFM